MTITAPRTDTPHQGTFDDLGTPLAAVDFVVVDLETTGGSPADSHITEIGAVRVRGGETLGELQTLVNPGVGIPPFIASLTGITDSAVATAPRIGAALPAFLEFARGAVLVAHNAGFDIGFLKAACRSTGTEWPGHPVVDTARLARVLLHRDEVRNHKLATLARFFRAGTTPNHRALADARATVDVLHGLLERAGGFGAHHLEDLLTITSRIGKEQRTKRTLADGLPDTPGVYVFVGPNGQSLYVGKSRSIRTRVRSYFTTSEKRGRILEMIRIAHHVEPIPCTTDLEAQVREVRLIAERRPPYNRRSKHPEKSVWLKLTAEPFPRLSIVSTVGPDLLRGAGYCGPYPSRASADTAAQALLDTFPLRTCTTRIARSVRSSPCIAAELGTCLAPCHDESAHQAYADRATAAAAALTDPSPVVQHLRQRMADLSRREEFEAAAQERERLRQFVAGAQRAVDRRILADCATLVAARADGRDWELHVIRHGRLAGAARVAPGDDPAAVVSATVGTAEHVDPPAPGHTAALPEESALLLAWLWSPGVRLVRVEGELALPLTAPHRHAAAVPRVLPRDRADYSAGPASSAVTATQFSRISLAAPSVTAALTRAT